MDRRGFLRSLVGGVAVAAAARAWPFRVYSFPTQPVLPANSFVWDDRIFWFGDTHLDPMKWTVNVDQKEAFDRLIYKVTHVDQIEKSITISQVCQSQDNWKNLSRSPLPLRDGLT